MTVYIFNLNSKLYIIPALTKSFKTSRLAVGEFNIPKVAKYIGESPSLVFICKSAPVKRQ